MKPPICSICDKDFRHSISEGGLVSFAHAPSQKEKGKRHVPHHPDYMCWFCGEHLAEAQKLSDLSAPEALVKLRALFS